MTEPPINSAKDLRNEIAAVVARYVQHLDFDAPTQLTTVKIDATGPGLHVLYAEHDTESPMLSVSINDYPPPPPGETDTPEDALSRRFLRRD